MSEEQSLIFTLLQRATTSEGNGEQGGGNSGGNGGNSGSDNNGGGTGSGNGGNQGSGGNSGGSGGGGTGTGAGTGSNTSTAAQPEAPSVGVVSSANTSEASSQSSTNDNLYKKIINKQFIGNGNSSNEVIDVVTEYQWILNKPKSINSEEYRDVPFLYAIEKFQRYGATATNLMNDFTAIKNSTSKMGGYVVNGLGGVFKKVSDALGSAVSSLAGEGDKMDDGWVKSVTDYTVGVGNKVSGYLEKGGNALLNAGGVLLEGDSELLGPYSHLYSLGETGKKYCFPFFGEGAASWNLSNDFSAEGSKGLISKALSQTISNLAQGMNNILGDFQDISNYLSGNNNSIGGFAMYNIEKAKAFNFPTTGKTVSVRFPLFNTTKKDSWKDNYKFIVLFGFRNMLFRKDNVQYYPPLIYDVTIPGWGRMPLSFVQKYVIKPVGMIRPLAIENFIGNIGGKNVSQFTVNVPEAWVVQIDFQSLVADSGNQFLSSLIDLPVNAKMS